MKLPSLTPIVFSVALLGFCQAAMATTPTKVVDGVLVGMNGMTLYTFDKDVTNGKSACNGQCALNWPPLFAGSKDSPSGDYTIFTREDGTAQWAFKGKPLYFWIKDEKPGDRTGEGVNGVWHSAKP